MGARAERPTRVDDEIDGALARLLPRRPHPDPTPDQQRLVEILPAIRPILRHLRRRDLDQPVAGDGLEVGQLGKLPWGAIDRELDEPVALILLHPAWRELDQLSEHPLGELRPAADGEADQRRPTRRRERLPWRGPPSGPRDSSRRSANSCCSRFSLAGTRMSSTTCWSP